MIFAQIPGADEAIKAAASHGWEASFLVAVMLAIVLLLGWMVKIWISKAGEREDKILEQAALREDRLAKRIDVLEDYIRTVLMQLVKDSTQAMLQLSVKNAEETAALSKLIDALHTTRICFATGDQQLKLVDTIANRVVNEIMKLKS